MFNKSLADCPLRVQRLLLNVQRYELYVTYTPGKYLASEDALQTMPNSDRRWKQLRQESLNGKDIRSLKEMVHCRNVRHKLSTAIAIPKIIRKEEKNVVGVDVM